MRHRESSLHATLSITLTLCKSMEDRLIFQTFIPFTVAYTVISPFHIDSQYNHVKICFIFSSHLLQHDNTVIRVAFCDCIEKMGYQNRIIGLTHFHMAKSPTPPPPPHNLFPSVTKWSPVHIHLCNERHSPIARSAICGGEPSLHQEKPQTGGQICYSVI